MEAQIETVTSKGRSKYCKVIERQIKDKNRKKTMVCLRSTYTTSHEVNVGIFKKFKLPNSKPGEPAKDSYGVKFVRMKTQSLVNSKMRLNGYQAPCNADSGGSWWSTETTSGKEKATALAVYAFHVRYNSSSVCGSPYRAPIAHSLVNKEINKWVREKAESGLSKQYLDCNKRKE